MRLTFHGVRGSYPSPRAVSGRYGGNTACVSVEVDGAPLVLLDLGTGLPFVEVPPSTRHAVALVTHLHFDHVQGLPFCPAVHDARFTLDVYGPRQDAGSLADAFARLVEPPYFPVPLSEIGASVRFTEVPAEPFAIGSAMVTARPVPHSGPTVGYRIEAGGRSMAYVSDHQAPPEQDEVVESVLELCDGVDLLVHEAQYTPEEFAQRATWGHCTVDFALLVARKAGARRLCLFHHDPWRTDDELDAAVASACAGGAEVTAAAEGTTVVV